MKKPHMVLAPVLLAASVSTPNQIVEAQPAAIPSIAVSPFVLPEGRDTESVIGALRYRGAIVIESTDGETFYGLSGFWVSPDGGRFAGTEGGNWVEGSLTYEDDGGLNGLAIDRAGPLLDAYGEPFKEERDRDAEALDYDGTHYLVGFETHDRVLRYSDFGSPAEPVALPAEALEGIGEGAGFSSVAHLATSWTTTTARR